VLPGTKRSRLTERASVHLDMIRGAAALAVLVGHVRGLFFITYHDLLRPSLPLAALYAATGLGHQAVIVFFVLSGFFIVSSIADAWERQQWSWTVYLVNRIARLSLVLAPALVLTWLADRIGQAMNASAWFYHQPLAFYFAVSPSYYDTIQNFIGNLFYLQGILVQPFGSNGPLWSLSYEFWYYLLFPLALCAFIKRYRLSIRAVCLLLAVFAAWFIGRTIALYFLIWLLGGAIAHSSSRQRFPLRISFAGALAIIPFAAALALSVARPLDSVFLTDSIVALGFGVWMYALVRTKEGPVWPHYAKLARLFAGFSYTLYAIHFPLLFLFRARFIGANVWRPDGIHLFYGLAIAIAATAIAYGIAQATEARTAVVRRKVMTLLPFPRRPTVVKS
jgi:peptidoglycan/LPS O-acetylase OafA/YrhL